MAIIEVEPEVVAIAGPVPEGMTEEECALAAILMDASGVDIAEFFWPNPTAADGCFRLYPYQWSWWRAEHSKNIDQGARDTGKALDVTTPIPTPDGWTTMGDLRVGDEVFAEDGRVCTVTEAFTPMRGRPCFEIEFDDGATIVADADHLWRTWTKNSLRNHMRGRPGHGSDVRTTAEIAETLRSLAEPNHRIEVAAALDIDERDLPIPPYTLGAWLGDGSSYRGHMTIGPQDEAEMVEQLRSDGFVVTKLTSQFAWALNYPGVVNHKTGTVTAALRRLGVRANKHIPPEYLRASAAQRLALLQGLIDTDGHVSTRWGNCEITQKNERLARDIFELITSLGQRPSFSKKIARCNGVEAGPVFRVVFQPNGIMPCRLHRKVEQVRPSPASTRLKFRRIVDVRSTSSVLVRCIAVNSPSHLFLAGEAMIPTHNSERICARACAFPFSFPGEEHALIAPEGSHIDRLTGRIEQRIKSVRLLLEMVTGGARGITHQPFEIDWRNGAQTYSRLPQRSGVGIKGIHAVRLDVDEAQDISERTWKEMPETVRTEIPGNSWCCHGVSKGVHDDFFEKTQEGSGWHVHRITKLHKPTYNPLMRDDYIKEYGGSDEAGDFKRNVYGEHGDTQNRIFILTHLKAGVDDRPDSDVNTEYYQPVIVGDEVAARLGSKVAVETSSDEATAIVTAMCEFPMAPKNRYPTFWAGMDVGLVSDPSEIVVLAEYNPDKREREIHKRAEIAVPEEGHSRFRMVSRIRLLRIPEPLQADIVMWLIDFYRPRAFSMDAGGNGIGLFMELQKRAGRSRIMAVEPPQLSSDASDQEKAEHAVALEAYEKRRSKAEQALTTIKGYKFGSKILVDFDEEKVVELGAGVEMKDMIEKAGIMQETKTAATDRLRTLVDNRRLLLPDDKEVVDQMNGQTFTWSTEPMDAYGKRRAVFSTGTFHILDAMRFFALGYSQEKIEQIIAKAEEPRKPVVARFVGF